jgi:lipopolysaccharide biosynthesis glycosyltransferase
MDNNPKKNVLVTLADQNFIPQAKQLFSSAYWNGGWQGDFLLLAHEIPKEDLRWFREKGIIVFPCRALTSETFSDPTHRSAALSKFYLFTPFFKQWKTVVYLDADIIVRASLEELVHIRASFAAGEAGGFTLQDEFLEPDSENQQVLREVEAHYSMEKTALNSGVLAFKTKIIKEGVFDKLLALYRYFDDVDRCGEETVLNLFFYKKWKKLPIYENAFPFYLYRTYGIPYEKIDAGILHAVGEDINKPWLTTSVFYQEWNNNLERADAMNLSMRQRPAKTWTKRDWKRYVRRFKTTESPFLSQRPFLSSIDRIIGKIGLGVKKALPSFYEKIRIKHE